MEIKKGQLVMYKGQRCRVESVRVTGIAAPYARLSDINTGEGIENGQLISHRLLRAIEPFSSNLGDCLLELAGE